MATPTLAAVRRTFGGAHVAWMGSPVAPRCWPGWTSPMSSSTHPPRTPVWRACSARPGGSRGRFDTGLLLRNAFRDALAGKLGRVRRLIGYDRDGRGWMLRLKLSPPRRDDGTLRVCPAIEYYLALAQSMGCDGADRVMRLAVEPRYARQADELLALAGVQAGPPVVLLNPGASFGPSKLYPADRFAAVADALHDRFGAQTLINAGPDEKPVARAVAAAMRRRPKLNLADEQSSLGLLKALTARSTLMITNDTGPRHIAAALGIGVVTIFGATDPGWTEIHYPRERIVRVDVACGPCQRKTCPLPAGAEHHQCMKLIRPEMVIDAAAELLSLPSSVAEARP